MLYRVPLIRAQLWLSETSYILYLLAMFDFSFYSLHPFLSSIYKNLFAKLHAVSLCPTSFHASWVSNYPIPCIVFLSLSISDIFVYIFFGFHISFILFYHHSVEPDQASLCLLNRSRFLLFISLLGLAFRFYLKSLHSLSLSVDPCVLVILSPCFEWTDFKEKHSLSFLLVLQHLLQYRCICIA